MSLNNKRNELHCELPFLTLMFGLVKVEFRKRTSMFTFHIADLLFSGQYLGRIFIFYHNQRVKIV